MGSEGTTLTGGSIRVQRHPSQVSVHWGKFYFLLTDSDVTQSKICPDVQNPGRGVVGPVNIVPSEATVHQLLFSTKRTDVIHLPFKIGYD